MPVRTRRKSSEDEKVALLCVATTGLVNSGFIGVVELGAASQVCRKISQYILRENGLWASLCYQRYPIIPSWFLPEVVDRVGHRFLFNRVAVSSDKQRLTLAPLQAPRHSFEDFVVVVNINYDGKVILSERLSTQPFFKKLSEEGGIRFGFVKPFICGKAEWAFNDEDRFTYESGLWAHQGLPVTCADFDSSKLQAEIVVVRDVRNDRAICSIYDSSNCIPLCDNTKNLVNVHPIIEEDGAINNRCKFDLEKEQTQRAIKYYERSSHVENWLLKPSTQAAEILRRLPCRVRLGVHALFRVVDKGCVAFTHFEIVTAKYEKDGTIYPFISSEEATKHGVTLLHLFSELQG